MAKKTVKKGEDKKMPQMNYSAIIFGIGLAIVIIGALLSGANVIEATMQKVVVGTLLVIGLVIGAINITQSEEIKFLIGSIAIIILLQPFLMTLAQTFSVQDNITLMKIFQAFFTNITSLIVPAAIIVALKAIFETAKDE